MTTHSAEEIRKLAETEKGIAARLINRVILKIPEGYENDAARIIVEKIVNAAVLEMTAIQANVTMHRSSSNG